MLTRKSEKCHFNLHKNECNYLLKIWSYDFNALYIREFFLIIKTVRHIFSLFNASIVAKIVLIILQLRSHLLCAIYYLFH